jgi:hypothetical protein
MDAYWIKSPWLFYGAAALLVGYLLYTMIRPRRGLRPGVRDNEPDL